MSLRRGLFWLLAAILLLLVALLVLLGAAIHSDEARLRLEREASAALGVALQVARVEMALYPVPALELHEVELQTRPPLTLERVELRPSWAALLGGELRVATLIVRRSVLPQAGIDKALALLQKQPTKESRGQEEDAKAVARFLPRRTVLDHLTWIDTSGKAHTLNADAELDLDGWPREVQVQMLGGRWRGAEFTLQRAQTYAWDLNLRVAGGSAQGQLNLQPAATASSDFVIKGQLQTRDVEVSRLTSPDPSAASLATQPLAGRLDASTTLSARARQPSGLIDALQTQSKFSVRNAVLQDVDLEQAAKTGGSSSRGKTPLQALSGDVSTRGKHIELRQLSAKSGSLTASGQISIPPSRKLSGLVNVELGGAVGVPMDVSGTLDDPVVSLTAGAKIGAALGTVLMPGLGTGAGATVGGKIGEGLKRLFGPAEKPER